MREIIRLLQFLGIVILLTGCDKDDYQQFIYAGSATGEYITYTEISPPEVIMFDYPASSSTYSPDLDGDGEPDVTFSFSGSASPGHTLFSMHVTTHDDVELCQGTAEDLAGMLEEDALIDEFRQWQTEELIMHDYSYITNESATFTGDWVESGKHYLGFRIMDKKKYRYGWIAISMESGASWVFQDFALISD
ncbi:MAG: hypothetical protein EOL88_09810 [Bacteroidia bacterium]|nr:hypothetical protein [Bacteroidia bacterium]